MTADLRQQVQTFLDGCDHDFGIAVSGGGDSMALLHLIAACRGSHQPHVITVNHHLREAAAAEAAFVAKQCAQLGLAHTTLNWTGWDDKGNLQAAARDARYQLLAEFAKSEGLEAILLGHTTDDVAETFLMRLARGSGIEGLAAMRPHFHRHGVDFDRPLLDFSRSHLRDFLREIDAEWIDDPSNDDPRFQRVQMRNLQPALDDVGLTVSRLRETAARIQDANEIVMLAVQHLASHATHHPDGSVSLDEGQTHGLHPETHRLFWTKLLQWMGQVDYPPRADAVQACLARARSEGRAQLAGCELTYSSQVLTMTREAKAVADFTCQSDEVWDGKWRLTGPHAAGLIIRALGEDGLKQVEDWRDTGLAGRALIVSPAIYQGGSLVAAPVAGLQNGWTAQIVADFHSSLQVH